MIGGNIYKAALENMIEAVYIRDIDKRIVYMNPASETLTGWSFKEARGKKWHEVFVDGAKGTGQDLPPHENRLKTRSGEIRRVRQSISTLYKGKKVNGAVVVLRELSTAENGEPPGFHSPTVLPPRNVYTVLMVDEDDSVLELGKDMLEKLEFNTLTAPSGREAVEVFRGHQKNIDCIMLDMSLPDISVEHTLTELKRIDPDIPVLISSGYADNNMERQFKKMPIAGFIRKPYSLGKLSSAIKKTLES